jgi:hypothetical protein
MPAIRWGGGVCTALVLSAETDFSWAYKEIWQAQLIIIAILSSHSPQDGPHFVSGIKRRRFENRGENKFLTTMYLRKNQQGAEKKIIMEKMPLEFRQVFV